MRRSLSADDYDRYWKRVSESKAEYRRHLAALPFEEKIAMLESWQREHLPKFKNTQPAKSPSMSPQH